MSLENIEIINVEKKIFESFNDFIMSDDTRVFNKLLARILLMNKVKNIPGDVVECGVFKGSGIFTYLKIKNILWPNSHRKVIGFDFFNTEKLLETLTNTEKENMTSLFNDRNFSHNINYDKFLSDKILNNGFKKHEFELIKGDIAVTSKEFVKNRPGFKINFLYMDLDLEKPTYDTLENFWNNISVGGIVVFDEYAYHNWTESIGVDNFLKDKKIKLKSLNFMCPTAYFVKE